MLNLSGTPATLNRAALFSVIFGAGGIFQAAAASDREH